MLEWMVRSFDHLNMLDNILLEYDIYSMGPNFDFFLLQKFFELQER